MRVPVTSPALNWLLARARERELSHLAATARPQWPRSRRPWFRRTARVVEPLSALPAVTIRHAFPDDALPLLRLAALDSSQPPSQPALVAEVDGELRAALSLRDGGVISDPFHRTQALVDLLHARAAQLTAADAGIAETKARRATGGVLRFREDG
jgi:hypothetical protein